MKKILYLLIIILSLITSGCGEESSAIEELKKTTAENLKLAQVGKSKSHYELGLQLLKNAYLNYCKTHKAQENYVKGEQKLLAELDKIKAKAVLNMVDAGSKNIFNMSKADGVKEMEEAAKKVKDYQNNHKEYINAINVYKKSFYEVQESSLKDGNYYFVNANTFSIGANLAIKNNFNEKIDFEKLDLYALKVIELRPGADRAMAEDRLRRKDMVMHGEVVDKRAEIVKDPKSGGVIRTLPVGEKIEVIDDVSEGPNIKISVIATGEEGWIWHTYIKYGEVLDERTNSDNQIQQSKFYNPTDTRESVTIMKGIVGATSSSELKDEGNIYSARNIVDGNKQTCWADGVSGLGVGESVTINFNRNYEIKGFRIFNGYQKNDDVFYKNSRPAALRVIGADGSNEVYPIDNDINEHDIHFKTPINVNSIKLVIEKVQRGSKYDDTCISEVIFF